MIPLTQKQRLAAHKLNMVVVAISYLIFAYSMFFSPHRWINAVAYHSMTEVLPISWWAVVFTVSAFMLLSAARLDQYRWWTVAALTGGIMVSVSWNIASFAQFVSSNSTTPLSFIAWLMFVYILVRAAFILDSPERVRIVVQHKEREHGSNESV